MAKLYKLMYTSRPCHIRIIAILNPLTQEQVMLVHCKKVHKYRLELYSTNTAYCKNKDVKRVCLVTAVVFLGYTFNQIILKI